MINKKIKKDLRKQRKKSAILMNFKPSLRFFFCLHAHNNEMWT